MNGKRGKGSGRQRLASEGKGEQDAKTYTLDESGLSRSSISDYCRAVPAAANMSEEVGTVS